MSLIEEIRGRIAEIRGRIVEVRPRIFTGELLKGSILSEPERVRILDIVKARREEMLKRLGEFGIGKRASEILRKPETVEVEKPVEEKKQILRK